MKTRVIGKNIEKTYHVEPHSHQERQEDGTMKFVFDQKPELVCEITKEEPVTICEYEGEPKRSNYYQFFYRYNCISFRGEDVEILKEVFHADTGDWDQVVNKEIMVAEINKGEAEKKLEALTRNYNRQIIEGDERLLAYCNLHHLKPAETDPDELRKLIPGVVQRITLPSDTYNIFNNLTCEGLCLSPNAN